MCMFAYLDVQMYTTYRGQKRALDPLELQLQVVVYHSVDAGT